nr:translation initiation factor IF-2-like [Pongo pygmaeus]
MLRASSRRNAAGHRGWRASGSRGSPTAAAERPKKGGGGSRAAQTGAREGVWGRVGGAPAQGPVSPPRCRPRAWRPLPGPPSHRAGLLRSEAAHLPPPGSSLPRARRTLSLPPRPQRSGPAPAPSHEPFPARPPLLGLTRGQQSYRLPAQGPAAAAAAAAACAKVGVPEAALAAGRPPSRPRLIRRSPCRPAAISDRRLRNLPKGAAPEMAEAGVRERGRGRERALATFPTASEDRRGLPQHLSDTRVRGAGPGAGDCGWRGGRAGCLRSPATRVLQRPQGPVEKTRLRMAGRMLPAAREPGLTAEPPPLPQGRRPRESQVINPRI